VPASSISLIVPSTTATRCWKSSRTNCRQPARRAIALLLETARKATVRVWAEQSPFELKDSLKKRGYRWNDGSDGRPKSWFIDVCETTLDQEIAFLRTEIYLRDVEPRRQALTAFTRFSARI
jgi:DNA polymerase III subunit epsilon